MRRTRIDRFKVKREMERKKISALQDLANLASISQTTLYAVLDTYSWRAATLDAIAHALDVSPVSLLTVDETEKETPPPAPEPPPPAKLNVRPNAMFAMPEVPEDERARFERIKAEWLAAAKEEIELRKKMYEPDEESNE